MSLPPDTLPPAAPAAKRGSVRWEMLVNVGFSVLRAALLLWLMRLAGQLFAPAVLGLFLLGRRHITTGAAFLSLGSTQTIQRYMSLTLEDTAARRVYFLLPVGILAAASLALLPLGWALQGSLATALFADSARGELAFVVLLSALLSIFGMHVISSLMALRRFYAYNLMNLGMAGLLPMAGLLAVAADPSAEGALWIAAGLLALAAGFAALLILRDLGLERPTGQETREALRAFRDFGLPRTLSAGIDAATLTVGAWWLRDTPEAASFLIIALTLFRLTEMVLMPASQVLGLASVRAARDPAGESAISRRTITFGLWAGGMGIAILQPWLGPVLHLWLANPELAAGTHDFARVMVWGLPFAILFYCLRGIIELRWTRPLNLVTQFTSLGVFFAAVLLLPDGNGSVVIANTAMLVVSGVLSLIWLRRDLPGAGDMAPGWFGVLVGGMFAGQTLAAGLPPLMGVPLGLALLAGLGALTLRQLRRLMR